MVKTWSMPCAQLKLPPDANVDVILDVARLPAHNVERPAAPVTTFLLGLAIAGGPGVKEAAAKKGAVDVGQNVLVAREVRRHVLVRGHSVETELVPLDVLHHEARLVDTIGRQ